MILTKYQILQKAIKRNSVHGKKTWKECYENIRNSPIYFNIINKIRSQFIGEADMTLEAYNTQLDWNAISTCLTTHYADERDIGTLEYQMASMTQEYQHFYYNVYSHLSLILNKISSMG